MSAVDESMSPMFEPDLFAENRGGDRAPARECQRTNERAVVAGPGARCRSSEVGVEVIESGDDLLALLFVQSVCKRCPEPSLTRIPWKNMSGGHPPDRLDGRKDLP